MTVMSLARKAGVTHAAISQILHGKQAPNIRTARRIAAALGIGLDNIVFPGEVSHDRPTHEESIRP